MRSRVGLALVGAVAAMAVAAGCGSGAAGGGGSTVGTGNEIHTIGTPEGQLDLVAWQGYTEPNVVKPFEAADRVPGAREVRSDLGRDGAADPQRSVGRGVCLG